MFPPWPSEVLFGKCLGMFMSWSDFFVFSCSYLQVSYTNVLGWFLSRGRNMELVYLPECGKRFLTTICQRGCLSSHVYFWYLFLKVRWLWLCVLFVNTLAIHWSACLDLGKSHDDLSTLSLWCDLGSFWPASLGCWKPSLVLPAFQDFFLQHSGEERWHFGEDCIHLVDCFNNTDFFINSANRIIYYYY